jgi:hypothetical protein
VTDELEAIRQLKARYCRFLDSNDVERWRGVLTTDVVVTPDMGSLENAATMHHCHTPVMEDGIIFGDGRELHGAAHYHETYEKRDGSWRIKTLHLSRTIVKLSGDDGSS